MLSRPLPFCLVGRTHNEAKLMHVITNRGVGLESNDLLVVVNFKDLELAWLELIY